MRLISSMMLLVAFVLTPSPLSAAQESISGGFATGGGSANITGRFSSDNGSTVAKPTTGPKLCFNTYTNYWGQLISVPVGCDSVVAFGTFAAPFALVEPTQPQAPQPEAIVRDYLKNLAMPVPQPQMSAPEGITGARHSVDLRIGSSKAFPTESTSFGTLQAKSYGTFVVDWGDGTRNTYSSSGGPWPNQDISHSWRTAGTYDVTVTARWNLDWSLGSYSGSISGLQTAGSVNDWVVLEAQSLLRR